MSELIERLLIMAETRERIAAQATGPMRSEADSVWRNDIQQEADALRQAIAALLSPRTAHEHKP